MQLYESIVSWERFKFVWRTDEFKSSLFGNLRSNHFIKSFKGIQPSPDCSAALSKLKYVRQNLLDSSDIFANHTGKSWELLAYSEWSSVLEVCSSNFIDSPKLLFFFYELIFE